MANGAIKTQPQIVNCALKKCAVKINNNKKLIHVMMSTLVVPEDCFILCKY